MFSDDSRTELYQRFERPVPAWFSQAKLGIFIHWGAYSVPAWAEPIGELGTIERFTWMKHNPYAEWYYNTIRIEGSPAAEHHREVFGGAPYDDFLDVWKAEEFDPDEWAALFARAGARYVVPTTKHHDGICLWEAPGTPRNTVARGPQRDLVGDLAAATRRAGMRFGTYYSGGLDWDVADFGPIVSDIGEDKRPQDEAYTAYANAHVRDLVERYAPDVLWGDINWPDAGKPDGPLSFAHVLDEYYAAVPDGVVNDRFGQTHWDFRTSEYQQGRDLESGAWENCRGIGYSFGYNRVEGPEHHLDGPGAVKHLLDVVSRGGNLLLDVGPTASGQIPELQRRCLEGLADWMAVNSAAVHGTTTVDASVARPSGHQGHDDDGSGATWIRWTRSGDALNAVVDARGEVELPLTASAVDLGSAHLLDGTAVTAREGSGGAGSVVVDVPASATQHGPAVVAFDLTTARGARA
ncbi:alpha-L-fucosidase [Quadrisphaera setariae]|uniref:alpha-L-fucosidase n=1 Tax=Quadrisphaera setariae TaxID=2593304 RepID=A0A5C8ZF84_9ACTN|nr:alpha-L-fucosidase [Quadrisphaera setariae]TXR56512.1 alpha-L-fucosidase [Quadrisphaera setariae]